jgi:hypothetical protein
LEFTVRSSRFAAARLAPNPLSAESIPKGQRVPAEHALRRLCPDTLFLGVLENIFRLPATLEHIAAAGYLRAAATFFK